MELDSRVRKLERSSRAWQCTCLGLLVLIAALGLAPRGVNDGVLRGEGLVLDDPDGDLKADFLFNKSGAFNFRLIDNTTGELAVFMAADASGGIVDFHAINFLSIGSEPSLGIGDMDLNESGFRYKNKDGLIVAKLGVAKDGSGYMSLANSVGFPTVEAGAMPDPENEDDPKHGYVRVWGGEAGIVPKIITP